MIAAPLAPYLAFLKRHRWSYVAAALVAFTATAWYLFTAPVQFRSAATTIVPYREVDADLRFGNGRPFPIQYPVVVNNHLEVLRGVPVKQAILARLANEAPGLLEEIRSAASGVNGDPTDLAMVRALERKLRSSSRDKTGVLRVEATASTAQGAARLANLSMGTYAAVQDSLDRRATEGWLDQLREEEDRWSSELSAREQQIEDFQSREAVSDVIEEARALMREQLRVQGQIDDLRSEREATAAGLGQRQAQLDELLAQLDTRMADSSIPLMEELRMQAARDEAQLSYVLVAGADEGAHVEALRDRITRARELLREHGAELEQSGALESHPVTLAADLLRKVRDLDTDLVGKDARIGELRVALSTLDERMAQMPSLGVLLARLQRERNLAEDILKLVQQRRIEAEVATQHRSTRLVTISPAQPPRRPASPRRLLALASAFLVTLLLGTVAGGVVESLDPTLRDSEEARTLTGLRALCRPPSEGGALVSPEAVIEATAVAALPGGGRVWLVDPDEGGSMGALASSLQPRFAARGLQIQSASLDEILAAGSAKEPSYVFLSARVRRTRRAALRDASELLRGIGYERLGLLVQ